MSGDFVRLSGGLGNQIFQLAASRWLSDGHKIQLLALGEERRNWSGQPDLCDFNLDSNVNITVAPNNPRVRLSNKFLRRLHSSVISNKSQSTTSASIVNKLFALASGLLLAREIGLMTQVRVSSELGYDSDFTKVARNALWIGFFQSWKYSKSDEMRELLGGPSLKQECKWLDDIEREAARTRPIVMHLRLGDYRHIPNVGIPDIHYYQSAIKLANSTGEYGCIWLFSDEVELAKHYFPAEIQGLRVIPIRPPFGCDTPAIALKAMTLGECFVIGNSTFSYWAARLSKAPGHKVFAPDPWFMNDGQVCDLLPTDWNKVSRLEKNV